MLFEPVKHLAKCHESTIRPRCLAYALELRALLLLWLADKALHIKLCCFSCGAWRPAQGTG